MSLWYYNEGWRGRSEQNRTLEKGNNYINSNQRRKFPQLKYSELQAVFTHLQALNLYKVPKDLEKLLDFAEMIDQCMLMYDLECIHFKV